MRNSIRCWWHWDLLESWAPEWWTAHPERPHILASKKMFLPLRLFGDEVVCNKAETRNISVNSVSSSTCRLRTTVSKLLSWITLHQSNNKIGSLSVETLDFSIHPGGMCQVYSPYTRYSITSNQIYYGPFWFHVKSESRFVNGQFGGNARSLSFLYI